MPPLGTARGRRAHGTHPMVPATDTNLQARTRLPKLAISTMAIYSVPQSSEQPPSCPKVFLGMYGWCQGARRLEKALAGVADVSLQIVSNHSEIITNLCPGAVVHAPAENLGRLVKTWARTHGKDFDPPSDGKDDFALATMNKLQTLGFTGFDALLFSDNDLMLLGEDDNATTIAQVRAAWSHRLPTFLADGQAELLGAPDWSAPINAGLWLVKPSAALYQAALGVLRRNQWSVAEGYDLVGRPTSFFGGINAHCNHPEALFGSQWFVNDDWHCVGCGTDQGLLFYIPHVLRHGAYRQSDGCPAPEMGYCSANNRTWGHTVKHWWAHPKPWELPEDSLHTRLEYFESLDLNETALSGPLGPTNGIEHACFDVLRAQLQTARRDRANETAHGEIHITTPYTQHVWEMALMATQAQGQTNRTFRTTSHYSRRGLF